MKIRIAMFAVCLICAGKISAAAESFKSPSAAQPASSTAQTHDAQLDAATKQPEIGNNAAQTQQKSLSAAQIFDLMDANEHEENEEFQRMTAAWARREQVDTSNSIQQLSQMHQQYQLRLEHLRQDIQQRLNEIHRNQELENMRHQHAEEVTHLNSQLAAIQVNATAHEAEANLLRQKNEEIVMLRSQKDEQITELRRQLEVGQAAAANQQETNRLQRQNLSNEYDGRIRRMEQEIGNKAFNKGLAGGAIFTAGSIGVAVKLSEAPWQKGWFSTATVGDCVLDWGSKCTKIMKEHPYCSAGAAGLGFLALAWQNGWFRWVALQQPIQPHQPLPHQPQPQQPR